MSLFTSRLTVALPAAAPPIRKNTSCSAVGLLGAARVPALLVPTCSSTGEFRGPASMITPAMSTPGTSATVMAGGAALRDQRGVAETEHDGVRPG